MDMHRNEDNRLRMEEERRERHRTQYAVPHQHLVPHAGAMPAPPVHQVNRRRTYEGERNVHHQDSFATVGLTPVMMGVPLAAQAGAPRADRAGPPVNRSAGAPSEMVQERRMGKRVTQYGIDQRTCRGFPKSRHAVYRPSSNALLVMYGRIASTAVTFTGVLATA
mmetsp:Transcript_5855/g.19437  ORF Transcript_5855/g.19437 Transcript_5855/m.19437 type:complete len:165 (-) Transcript_5855:362-856(-)